MKLDIKKLCSILCCAFLNTAASAHIKFFNGTNDDEKRKLAEDFTIAQIRSIRYNAFYDFMLFNFDSSKLQAKCEEFGIKISLLDIPKHKDDIKPFIKKISSLNLKSDENYEYFLKYNLGSLNNNNFKTVFWQRDDSSHWEGAANIIDDLDKEVNIDFIFVNEPGNSNGKIMLKELVEFLNIKYPNRMITLTPKHKRLVEFYKSCGFKLMYYPDDELSLCMVYSL